MQSSDGLIYEDNARTEMIPLVPPASRLVLDVGCAGGAFGAELARQRPYVSLVGVDTDRRYLDVADARGCYLRLVEGAFPLDEASSTDLGLFDCIVFNDVLEHMLRPDIALRDARALLTPGSGVIVCSIPNVRYLPVLADLVFRSEWRYQSSGVLDFTHLRFFTFRSAKRLIRASGYDIVKARGINGILALRMPGWVRRILQRVQWLFPNLLFPQIAIVARVAETPHSSQTWAP